MKLTCHQDLYFGPDRTCTGTQSTRLNLQRCVELHLELLQDDPKALVISVRTKRVQYELHQHRVGTSRVFAGALALPKKWHT